MMKTRFPHKISAVAGYGSAIAASLLGLCGCTFYQAKPLDQKAVDAALQAPKIDDVKIAAAKFEHKILKPVVIDGQDGFSPDEIALMTVIVSPSLRSIRDQRGIAQAQVLQAGLLPNPQLGYTVDRPHANDIPDLVTAKNLGLSWEITSLLTHHAKLAAAKASAQSLDLNIAWQEWGAAQDARLRAFRILSLEQRLPLAREIERDLADNIVLIQKALSLGHKTGSDLTIATAAWSTAQDALLALNQQINGERFALNLALGLPPDQPVKIKPAPVFPELLDDNSVVAATFLQGLETRRLDLVALTLGYQSEEATLRSAVISQFPRIGLTLTKANDTSNIKTRGYGVTIDIPIFDRNHGQIAIEKATRQQLFDEYVQRVAESRSEVVQILEDVKMTRTQLKTVTASLPALEQLVTAYEKAMTTHNADIASYRDARGALATRRMDLSQLQQSLLELSVALEIATGRPLLNRTAVN